MFCCPTGHTFTFFSSLTFSYFNNRVTIGRACFEKLDPLSRPEDDNGWRVDFKSNGGSGDASVYAICATAS